MTHSTPQVIKRVEAKLDKVKATYEKLKPFLRVISRYYLENKETFRLRFKDYYVGNKIRHINQSKYLMWYPGTD